MRACLCCSQVIPEHELNRRRGARVPGRRERSGIYTTIVPGWRGDINPETTVQG